MYFRIKQSSSGQTLQLLESYRDSQGQSRNRVVVSLGNAKIAKSHWKAVAISVASKLYGRPVLLEGGIESGSMQWVDWIVKRVDRQGRWQPFGRGREQDGRQPEEDEPGAPSGDDGERVDGVLVDKIEHCHTTSLGPALVGLRVWERLGMPEFLSTIGFNAAQRDAAAASVVNRLVDPVTENFLYDVWLGSSSLPDLLGEAILKGGKERYYRVTDKLLAHKDEIEGHLRKAQARHFNLNRTVFLYDLTNTHFEGECKANPKAKRGKSKQKRNDCPLVVVGMVFDEFGFELAHQTFEGNKNDSKSLVDMLESLRRIVDDDDTLFSTVKPIVVVDAGVATKGNLKLLRKEGYSYLVNDSRRKRSAHRDQFNQKEGFRTVGGRFKNGQERPPVRVKVIENTIEETETHEEPQPDGSVKTVKKKQRFTEHLILCRSDARRNKELAIISNAEMRYLAELQALADRVEKGTLKDPVKIQQAIGRVGTRNTRARRFYTVKVVEEKISAESGKGSRNKGKSSSTKQRIEWERDDKRLHENDDILGCYVLRTDRLDFTDEEYWHLYMTLIYAEDGFHALKSDLGLRPNHHRIERRVDAHVSISVLAYHILHHILYALKLAGDNRCWFTIRQILQTHAYTTIMMPTADGKLYRLRKAGQPEECQREIYRRIGIKTCGLPATKNVVPYETTL